jgi:4-amino-4-deoxy-L-arabinose transferase-like glycosyltransferase
VRKRWVWFVLAAIMLLALYLRTDFLRSVFHQMSHDSIEYDRLVRQWLEKGIYGYKSTQPNAYVTPGYPLIMAAVYKIVNYTVRDPLPFLRHGNSLLSLLNLLLIFMMARKWAGGDWAGLLAAFLAAIYPPFIWANGAILTEVPATFLLTLYLYVQLLAFESRLMRDALTAGALLGLTALIRPEFMPLCVPLYLIYWLQTRDRQFWKPLVAALLGLSVVMAPWWIRNVVTMDKLILTATQTNPFYAGTFPDKNYNDNMVDLRGKTESELAIERLKVGFTQHTWTFVRWYTYGKLKYIYGQMFWGSGHDPLYEPIPLRAANWLHRALIVSGLLGMLLALRRWREPLVLLGAVVAVMTGVRILFVPEYRYNFTVMPLFTIFLAYLGVSLGRWAYRRLRRLPSRGTGRLATAPPT